MAAGLGFKTFQVGEVLLSSDVNGYLMQGVLVFANAAARDAAITSPQEGQCCYLKDTDAVLTYSGAAWVGFDDSNAIQNTIVDAKGDIVAASGSDTPARLAVGNSGDTLVSDSAETTGLRYNPPVGSLANPIINGGFDVWQRGTTFTISSNVVTAVCDRWQAYRNATGLTVSRQTTSDTTNLPNIQYAMRTQRDSGNTSTQIIYFASSVETINAIPFAGKTVTLSYYAKCGANYSASGSTINVRVRTGTGTDQSVLNGYTGNADPLSTSATLTTTWQRFAHSFTVSATATEFAPYLNWTPVGTASTNDWVEITGVQFDVGTWTASTAPTFRRSGGTIQGELAACQRYYNRLATGTGLAFMNAHYYSTTQINAIKDFPVVMRTTPTLDAASGSSYYLFIKGTNDAFNSLTIASDTSTSTGSVFNNSEASGTAGYAGYLYTNNASAYVAFSAEL